MWRMAKLLRIGEVSKYFGTKDIEYNTSKVKTGFNIKGLGVFLIYALTQHFIGCIWLIVGRIDPNRTNWFYMVKYYGPNAANNVRPPSDFEKYIDAQIFTMATMTGLGYGNIVPSTNLEWFADIFIMIAGASIYAGLFSDFAVAIYN